MVVHLTTNASLINGTETFQRAVFLIHSPGKLLPLIEWGFIFLPLIFHAGVGVWIAKTGRTNSSQYRYSSNRRYTWQRWTGFIALVYLFTHVLHLHGWWHAEIWLETIRPLKLGVFRPYNAASSLVSAMNGAAGFFWAPFYLIGVLSCVYHLANGLWTAGITWGLWISPAAQARATKVCTAIGVLLAIISVTAWWAAVAPGPSDVPRMRAAEDRMYAIGVEAGLVEDLPEKRSEPLTNELSSEENSDAPSP
tara:strand:- start:164601 stop:165353 length:753 start_codon:yes stop_codon:yes gene_type:complete